MNNLDKQYKSLIQKIFNEGHNKSDRTNTGTKSIFGYQMRFNMSDGFPLLTLRKIHIKSLIHELLWFLGSFDKEYAKFGNTNIRYLLDNDVTFWSEWPYKEYRNKMKYHALPDISLKEFENNIKNNDDFALKFGSIGPGYGEQWLNSGSIDIKKITDDEKSHIFRVQGINQIDNVIKTLKKNPDSRRMIVDSWNPLRIDEMLLPPCHMMFQFYSVKMTPSERLNSYNKWINDNNYDKNIDPKLGMKQHKFPTRYLSLQMYQRSVDSGLGLPFNIASYSLLLHIISQITNMIPNEFIWTGGDTHIYNNHTEQLKELINRESLDLPTLKLNSNIKNIYDFRYDDIIIENYNPHKNIKMDVSV